MISVVFLDNLNYGTYTGKFENLIAALHQHTSTLRIVTSIAAADVIVCNRLSAEIQLSKKPVILCERYDSPSIGHARHDLADAQVLACFKEFMYRDANVYESGDHIKGRHHYALIAPTETMDKRPNLATALVQKLHCVVWNWPQYTHLDLVGSMKRARLLFDKNQKRDIDIMYVAHMHNGDAILHQHRKQIFEAIQSLSSRWKVFTEPLPANEYEQYLARSKVCIAAWGIGPRIATDQKAILCGSVLMKPDSQFLKTYPDIYDTKGKFYVPFHMSSIVRDIENVLKKYEVYYKQALEARKNLLKVSELEFAHRFAETLTLVLNQHNTL